jgi:hypothetical protein
MSQDSNKAVQTESGDKLPSLNEFVRSKNSRSGAQVVNNYLPKVSVDEKPVGVEVQRERTRTRLAGGLLGLLAFSLLGIGAYVIVDVVFPQSLSEERKDSHREIITIVWTSQVTLVSGALGFYFASERNGSDNSKD